MSGVCHIKVISKSAPGQCQHKVRSRSDQGYIRSYKDQGKVKSMSGQRQVKV